MVAVVDGVIDVADAYAAHRLTLLRLAVLLVDDSMSAEDVVQDAFVSLHRNCATIANPDAVFAYLRVTVVHNARSVLRRRKTARAHLRASDPDSTEPADFKVLLDEEHQSVIAAVRLLPPKQREVIVLRYWSGMTEAEIAQDLGISRGAVSSQASRAIAKLEAILKESR